MEKKLFENVGENRFKVIVESMKDDVESFHEPVIDVLPRKDPSSSTPEERDAEEKAYQDRETRRPQLLQKQQQLNDFIKKNYDQIRSMYYEADYSSQKDPDVKKFAEYIIFDNAQVSGRKKEPLITSPLPTTPAHASFVRGLAKVVAVKNKTLADKILDTFKSFFKP